MARSRILESGGLPTPPAVLPTVPLSASYLHPGPPSITPSPGLLFGQPNSSTSSVMNFLPSRDAADRLIEQFFHAVHPVVQILHRPTFQLEYKTFWTEVLQGIEPPGPIQSIVFAVMLAGVVSMEGSIVIRDFGVSQTSLIDNFKLGAETALVRANFLRTTKVTTLQAFILYLVSRTLTLANW